MNGTLSTASKRNEVMAVVSCASTVGWVESGGGAPAVGRGSSCCWRLSPLASASVSPLATFPLPRSSNRTCGFPASGFPMGSCFPPHVAWSGFPEPLPTLLDVCQWSCPASVPSCPHRKAPSLRQHYPASPVLRASPPPCRPNLSLAGCPLTSLSPPTGLPMLLPSSSSLRASVTTPAVPKGCPRRSLPPPASAFPISQLGRRPHCLFRGLLDVHSRSGPQVR